MLSSVWVAKHSSFLILTTVERRRPLPSKICAHSDPPPSEKRRLRLICAYNVSTIRASEKSSIFANRKSTMRFSPSYRWIPYVTPNFSTGWLKKPICRLKHIHLYNRNRWSQRLWIWHAAGVCQSPSSNPTRRKSGCGPGLGKLSEVWATPVIFLQRLKLATSNLVHSLGLPMPIIKSHPEEKWEWPWARGAAQNFGVPV